MSLVSISTTANSEMKICARFFAAWEQRTEVNRKDSRKLTTMHTGFGYTDSSAHVVRFSVKGRQRSGEGKQGYVRKL
jgi:hypothetical protein